LLTVVACGCRLGFGRIDANGSVQMGRGLIFRPGSPVAFVKRWRLDSKGAREQTFWGEKSTITVDVSDVRYSRIDLRTCVEVPVRRFGDLTSEFAWGAPADGLWIFAPGSPRAVEPVGGGPRIDVSVELGARPDWPLPNPEVPRDADVGAGWRQGTGLHVWDLSRRGVADVPLPPEIKVQSFIMPQRGDRTLLAIARREGEEVSRQLDVVAVAAPVPGAPAPVARTVHVALSVRSGPPRTRSLAGGARLALLTNDPTFVPDENELVVVDTTGGSDGYRMKLGFDPWGWTRSGHAWLVRVADPKRQSPSVPSCRSTVTVVDLETGRPRSFSAPGCTNGIEMIDGAPFAVLQGAYPVEPSLGGGPRAGASDDVMNVVKRVWPTIGRLLLDLERGTLTSLPDAGGTPYVMGGTVYFADTTRVLAIDLAAPTRMRVAVTGLENVQLLALEPSSRRIVMGDRSGLLIFDVDGGRVTRCL
jgi:hypothetical protein